MITVLPEIIIQNKPTQKHYEELLRIIECAGRVCYKSEDKIKDDSAEKFIHGIIKRGHEAVLEHGTITVKILCDRGVSHEIVRHRIAAYCQESTRYCNYSQDKFNNQITCTMPYFLFDENIDSEKRRMWENAMKNAESSYFALLEAGCTPQEARSVLPTSLKTEIVVTYNIREWRHFLKLRIDKAAHPDIRNISKMILDCFKVDFPVFFEDIEVEE